jgi:hypothetical protein
MSDISISSIDLEGLISLPIEEDDFSLVTTNIETGSMVSISEHFDNDVTIMDGSNKVSRCILTYFPPNSNREWLEPDTFFLQCKNRINIWVSQFENCPDTGRLHCHAYVEFKHSYQPRFKTIRDCFQKHGFMVSIRLAKKSNTKQRQGAVNYVSHPDKRAPDCDPCEAFFWEHNNPIVKFDPTCVNNKKRKADVTEEQRLHIESKPMFWSWDQIVHETEVSKRLLATCSWGKTYHAGRYAEIGRRNLTDVIIMYGAGGTGKTTLCMEHNSDKDPNKETRYYRRNPDDGAFWGGGRTAYKGQSVIHFEEFTGQEMFSRLKEVCDLGKPGPAVNVKNGGVELNHDTVIFTSNTHPAGWYHKLWKDDPKQFHPFWRRVTKVLFFPSHRDDGSLNIPSETVPPYYVDQTQDWESFGGDYNSACDHATEYWPLKAVNETPGFAPGFRLPNGGGPALRYC